MRLVYSILTTLAVGILSSLILAVYAAAQTDITGTTWYAFVMIFGNTIIPILLTVCLFAALKKHIDAVKWPVKYIIQAVLVLIIMITGVFLMTISISISYYGWPSGLAPGNVSNQFDGSYKGYMPDVLLDALLIPVIYYWISKIPNPK